MQHNDNRSWMATLGILTMLSLVLAGGIVIGFTLGLNAPEPVEPELFLIEFQVTEGEGAVYISHDLLGFGKELMPYMMEVTVEQNVQFWFLEEQVRDGIILGNGLLRSEAYYIKYRVLADYGGETYINLTYSTIRVYIADFNLNTSYNGDGK